MGYYDPVNHHRRSIRLKGYDYSQPGAYFVTMCTQGRECLFGDVVNGEMVLNEYGEIVKKCWWDLTNHYQNIQLDHYVVMPNHFHGIIIIKSVVVGAGFKPAPTTTGKPSPTTGKPAPTTGKPSPTTGKPAPTTDFNQSNLAYSNPSIPKNHGLSEFVRALKTFSSKRINQIRNTPGTPVWQRNYYEHIIRDNLEYQIKTAYIRNNPKNWQKNEFNDSPGQ